MRNEKNKLRQNFYTNCTHFIYLKIKVIFEINVLKFVKVIDEQIKKARSSAF